MLFPPQNECKSIKDFLLPAGKDLLTGEMVDHQTLADGSRGALLFCCYYNIIILLLFTVIIIKLLLLILYFMGIFAFGGKRKEDLLFILIVKENTINSDVIYNFIKKTHCYSFFLLIFCFIFHGYIRRKKKVRPALYPLKEAWIVFPWQYRECWRMRWCIYSLK